MSACARALHCGVTLTSHVTRSHVESFLALFNNPRDEEVQNLLDAAQAADEYVRHVILVDCGIVS